MERGVRSERRRPRGAVVCGGLGGVLIRSFIFWGFCFVGFLVVGFVFLGFVAVVGRGWLVGWLVGWLEGRRLRVWVGGERGRGGEDGYIGGRETGSGRSGSDIIFV